MVVDERLDGCGCEYNFEENMGESNRAIPIIRSILHLLQYQQFNDQMSLSKHRAKISAKTHMSSISNSQDIRKSLFKNDVLCEIRNIQCIDENHDRRSQKSQKSQCSSKENQSARSTGKKKVKQNGSSYASIAKLVEEKNIVIKAQSKQLTNLKQSIEKLRKEQQKNKEKLSLVENTKSDEYKLLKEHQRENQTYLKELENLRSTIKDLKVKVCEIEGNNKNLRSKNDKQLQQNEQLTVKVTELKAEITNHLNTIAQLNTEVDKMKGESKGHKELQGVKNMLEQRCRNHENKINEYVVKYNDVQTEFSEAQIKYYRIQKSLDENNFITQELELQNKKLKKQLEEEKQLSGQYMMKWKMRLQKLEKEQTQQDTRNFKIQEELQSKYNRLEIMKEWEQKLRLLEDKHKLEISEFSQKIATLEQQLMENQKTTEQLRFQIDNKERRITLLSNNNEDLQIGEKGIKKQLEIFKKKNQQAEKRKEELQQEIVNLQTYVKQLQSKAKDLMAENQRVNTIYSEFLSKTQAQNKAQQNNRSTELNILQQQNKELAWKLEEQSSKEQRITDKLDILENQIKQKQKGYRDAEESKDSQIQKLNDKVLKTNHELKDIKICLAKYKEEIRELNKELQQREKNSKQDIEYMRAQWETRCQEETGYYKRKYEEMFRQNSELSNKVCTVQQQHTEQINKHAQLLRINAQIENQIRHLTQNKQEYECRIEQEISSVEEENQKLQGYISKLELQRQNIDLKYQQATKQIEYLDKSMSEQDKRHRQELEYRESLLKQKYQNQKQQYMKNCESQKLTIRQQLTRQSEKKEWEIKERLSDWQQKYQRLSQEFDNKNRLLQENYSIIRSKEQQMKNLVDFRNITQNQEYTKMKEYNVKLTQQLEDITRQFNRCHQQLKQLNLNNTQYRNTISELQKENNSLKTHNMQLHSHIGNLQKIKFNIQETHNEQLSKISSQINILQQSIQNKEYQLKKSVESYQQVSEEYRRFQNQQNRASRMMIEETNKKNRQNSREIEQYQIQIKVLKQQNIQIQKLMQKQLSKRKTIIEQLINQKKMLYGQIKH